MYVILEGIDRAGKSTQIELLKKRYPKALFTKEPGGTPFGQKIRDIVLNTKNISPRAEALLFLADRNEHIQKVIKPNIEKLIISDRGFVSGVAYAHVKENIDLETLLWLNSFAMENIEPDKIVLIEISKDALLKRMHTEKLDTIEARGVEYLLKVQEIMKKTILKTGIEHLFIDASLDKETINHKISDFIEKGR
ncbi:dTMP kinase [Nitrosophilus alvini]|uniref:dTMP kinase n=1 Tax=Nitrosophilus alvini TaxID=2714855 RepID=UPI00190D14EC|nr:dTMP kinase [Nitrosophilus alvini]